VNIATLSPADRRALKARAHALDAVVMIGEAGLTDAVAAEIERALARHELIKIRVLGDDRDARGALLDVVCARTGAAPVQHIGKILVVFRPRPPEEAPAAEQPQPTRSRAAPSPRRTAEPKRGARKKPTVRPKRIMGRAPPKPRRAPRRQRG
jgi:RNA-binding protein